MSSLFFPFCPAWCFAVSPVPGSSVRRFVLHFEGAAPCGFVPWVRACPSVQIERVFPSESWRGFGPGVAVRLVVRDQAIAEAIKKSAPKGAGGSLHPGNKMLG